MTDRELEQRLRAWYATQVPDTVTAPDDLRARLAAIPTTAPTPLRPISRRRGFTLFGVAAVLLVGGALAAGSGLLRLTAVVPPTPSDAPLATALPSTSVPPTEAPSPTANHRVGDLIAFTKSTGQFDPQWLWIVGSDGRGAHELLADAGESQTFQAWSPDGSRVLYQEYRSGSSKLYLADPDGGQPQLVETGCVSTTPASCEDSQVAFSPDGRRIAFVRASTTVENGLGTHRNVILTMDLASGRTIELNATAPMGARPGWSPDGRQIVFSRSGGSGFTDKLGQFVPGYSTVWLIDSDGQETRQVSPAGLNAYDAAWSPDGAQIAFVASNDQQRDLYTVNPDGTDVRRLTTDGLSQSPTWTTDGRILFTRRASDDGDETAGWWIMDADGSNAAQVLSAAAIGVPPEALPFTRPAWQPFGGAAIVPPPYVPTQAVVTGPPAPTPVPPPPPELSPGFSWTGSMAAGESSPLGVTATLLADGHVLFVGSCDTQAQLYDPGTGTFSPTGSLSAVRGGMTATLLRDGRVLVAGGYACGSGDATWASAELYDPTTGTFSPTGSMAAPRSQHTATLLADGRVLIAGGLTGSSATAGGITLASYRTVATDAFLTSAEIYDPTRGTFSKTGSMSSPHRGHTATLLKDGRVLVVGNGGESSPAGNVADVYDPATGRFSPTGSMKSGRYLHTATLLQDGRVLIVGGRTRNDSVRASAELYDPRSGRFSSAGSMEEGRQQHSATLLRDGRVLIAGGYWSDGQHSRILSSTEMYDPVKGTFSPVGSMGVPRSDPTATLLDDGRVLIAGGFNEGPEGAAAVPSAVLYRP